MRISDWSSDVCSSDLTLLSNAWLAALARDNVELVDAPVRRIVEDGVEMQDGTRHRVDAIVYGTGFAATQFLAPMDLDRKSVGEGTSVSVRVDLGCRRIIKKQDRITTYSTQLYD